MKNKVTKSYNFLIYANHLNSHVDNNHKCRSVRHTIDIDRVCNDFENFYALNPDFYVSECNVIMKSLNDDYTKYIKWMIDD